VNAQSASLRVQTRLVCKLKQGWFADPNKAGLQIQTWLVCKSKHGWFANPNMAGLQIQTRQVCGNICPILVFVGLPAHKNALRRAARSFEGIFPQLKRKYMPYTFAEMYAQ